MSVSLSLEDVRAARARIFPYLRRTPLIAARPLLHDAAGPEGPALFLKLETLQVTGAFKARGAVSKVMSLSKEAVARGLVTASAGNHGLGMAYAGKIAGTPATIYLPGDAPQAKALKLAAWGATVIRHGKGWDESDQEARAVAERDGMTYVHAFGDPAVVAGQGTIGLEILEDMPDIDMVLVAIGGGGLISGVATALKALAPRTRVIGVEPTGAPTLYESVRAGRLVELERVDTLANTLAPRLSTELNLGIIRDKVDGIVLVSDEEMREAARWLWFELGVAAELSGAAAVAAWLFGRVSWGNARSVCALVCGAGTDGLA